MQYGFVLTTSDEEKLVIAMKKAIFHARSVARRSSQKLDRCGRVNQFMTSLRHWISQEFADRGAVNTSSFKRCDLLYQYFCDRSIWFDIGELETYLTDKHDCIKQILGKVNSVISLDEYNYADIHDNLADLEQHLTFFNNQLERVKRINEQGDVIITNLTSLFAEA